jgi:polysaccharide biosynthesis protein VpsQ
MKSWYAFGAYTAFIIVVLIGAYVGIIPTEIALVPAYDSIGHFVLYGIWFYLLHEALGRKMVSVIPLAFLILFPIVALEEFAQTFASTRTFSLVDLFWGFAGMVTFLTAVKLLSRQSSN